MPAQWASPTGDALFWYSMPIDTIIVATVDGCPCCGGLEDKLRLAEYRVSRQLCDLEHVEESTYGPGGFSSPEALLGWPKRNRPTENPVFSHGDCCLPNLFAANGAISGFIDLGRSGASDPCQDIALSWRSLRDNLAGRLGLVPAEAEPAVLFDELGICPDWELIRYYVLLDELF